MPLNASAVAKLWADRAAAAGQRMKDGVNAVTESPTAKAAAAKDQWLAGVQRAATEGRYEDGLNAVTLQDWKTAMTEKGVSNMATGVRASVGKMERFLRDFLPYAESVSDEVRAMPKGTLQDSINRATAAITKLAQFRKSRR